MNFLTSTLFTKATILKQPRNKGEHYANKANRTAP